MQEEFEAADRFSIALEWLLAIQERYPAQLNFGLLNVCLHGREVLGQAYGVRDATKMLGELAGKLRHAFRKTDLVMRDGTDFWILVPYTDPITVTDKVTTLLEVTAQNGLAIVDRDVALFTLDMPLMAAAPKSAVPQFLDYLKRHRQVAIGWQRPAQTS
mgnify:CR=1 FL=1